MPERDWQDWRDWDAIHRRMFCDEDGNFISREQWMELKMRGDSHIASDYFHSPKHKLIHVSTIWTGLNTAVMPETPPLIFETMVFFDGGVHETMSARYCTKDQALAGHQEFIEQAEELYGPLRKLKTPTTVEEMIEWENMMGGDDDGQA